MQRGDAYLADSEVLLHFLQESWVKVPALVAVQFPQDPEVAEEAIHQDHSHHGFLLVTDGVNH
jgi:hypothetical protein